MKLILGLLATLIVLSALLFVPWYVYATSRSETLTINKSERIVASDGNNSKYLIYTKQGVFEDSDSLLKMKFNSSDLYNQLQSGKTYNCDVYGWRLPFFSQYPNIVRCR